MQPIEKDKKLAYLFAIGTLIMNASNTAFAMRLELGPELNKTEGLCKAITLKVNNLILDDNEPKQILGPVKKILGADRHEYQITQNDAGTTCVAVLKVRADQLYQTTIEIDKDGRFKRAEEVKLLSDGKPDTKAQSKELKSRDVKYLLRDIVISEKAQIGSQKLSLEYVFGEHAKTRIENSDGSLD